METKQGFARKITLALRVILGALFVYAGSAKLTDLGAFAGQVQQFGLGNPVAASVFAHYLPFLEVACGLALFVRRLSGSASMLCIFLLIVFEGALLRAWQHGYAGGCGCFGKFFGGTSVQAALLRNLALLAAAGTLLAREWSSAKEECR